MTPAPIATADTASPRRSLILAGGGMRVAYQAGVIKALAESGLAFHHGDGTSGGTMNLAMLLSGLDPNEMCSRWRSLDVHDFASFMPIQDYLRAWDMAGMGSSDGVRNRVFPHLGIDVGKINSGGNMAGTFNVCRKVSEIISHDQLTLDLLVAGISLPIFMPAVRVNGDWYTDSVWIKDANLMEAVRRGSEEIWVVWCIGNTKEYKPGAFNQYVHMIEMSANGKLFEEFQQIAEFNAGIARGQSPFGHKTPVRLHVIHPLHPLPLDPDYFLGRITAATLIEMGYADAKRYLERAMKPEGLPYQPEVTQMQSDGVGISFSETMSGGLAMGATDPQTGSDQGLKANTVFTMHANIRIPDLDRFAADPEHQGEITGNVSYPPFGSGILCKNGVFKLFSPANDPKLKYMVYELGFEHNGQDYYMAGHKDVRDDPVIDSWKETTTLYTTLHAGRDKSGKVVGAGVLKLGVPELISLVRTMHATNASTVAEKSKALGQFGKFFLRELWDSYVHHLKLD
jgi:predicted acylesterase/phospholipase RssA